jgi:hypothetical protein
MTAMKTAVVKDFIYFSEGPTDQPPVVSDPTHFGMKVMVLIGTDDDRPGDAFDAFPCTGSWLAAELAAGKAGRLSDDLVTEHDEGVWPLAGVWVMDRWSQERFEAASVSSAGHTARLRTGARSPRGSGGCCRGSTTTASTTSSTPTPDRRSRPATRRRLWTVPAVRSRPVDTR